MEKKFGNIYYNQPSQAEKCKLDDDGNDFYCGKKAASMFNKRRALLWEWFVGLTQSFQGRVSHLLLAVRDADLDSLRKCSTGEAERARDGVGDPLHPGQQYLGKTGTMCS